MEKNELQLCSRTNKFGFLPILGGQMTREALFLIAQVSFYEVIFINPQIH